MGQHPEVLAAMHEAIDRCGAGAGGTRNISGTNHYHVLLERELADLHGKEAALLFTSGYVSNWAALGTLGAPAAAAASSSPTRSNHASMIEGIRHSRRREAHLRAQRSAPISTASWPRSTRRGRSWSRSSASIRWTATSRRSPSSATSPSAHGAMTYLDEVHAVGLYGPRGGGIAERDGVTPPPRP